MDSSPFPVWDAEGLDTCNIAEEAMRMMSMMMGEGKTAGAGGCQAVISVLCVPNYELGDAQSVCIGVLCALCMAQWAGSFLIRTVQVLYDCSPLLFEDKRRNSSTP